MGPGLVCRTFRVDDAEVVWLRSILEGYEGLAHLTGDGSGIIAVISTSSRQGELDEVLADLGEEVPLVPVGIPENPAPE